MTDVTYNLNGGFKPTTKRSADLNGPDFYPTPRWATFALIDNEKFSGDIWECACGDGTMSKVLEETGCAVLSSDLYDRGYGEVGLDFLTSTRYADNIITNPPYNCAEGFVASGVKHARRKLALLLRLAILEGANRAQDDFLEMPAISGLGLQRAHNILSERSKGEGQRYDSLCLVRVGQKCAEPNRIEVAQARLQSKVHLATPRLFGSTRSFKPSVDLLPQQGEVDGLGQ